MRPFIAIAVSARCEHHTGADFYYPNPTHASLFPYLIHMNDASYMITFRALIRHGIINRKKGSVFALQH